MPVVSTIHADIPEVVLHDRTGLLGPEPDPDILANKLDLPVAQPRHWELLGPAARRHIAENYNVRTQVALLEDLYASLLTLGPRSGA